MVNKDLVNGLIQRLEVEIAELEDKIETKQCLIDVLKEQKG